MAVLPLALPLVPLAAQQTSVTADEAIGNAKQMYGPPPPASNCSKAKEDQNDSDIVVCARKKQDDSQFRVKGTSELDPDSKEALDDGQPHAPDFAESCKKNPGGACMKFGSAPDPAYMIDFTLLPNAPEGSDADKIAKGEKKAD
ncbi:MAG: hypothetical protein H6R45_1244 [Proteobacteria bacterium]|nr:hypothetical protein [Pseudomonadota bacterium]